VGPILNAAVDPFKIQFDVDRFQSLGLAARSGGRSVADLSLPTDILDVGPVGDSRSI
jgi:hypothetical protein